MANNVFKRREITLDTFNDLNKEMIASFSQGDRISDKLTIRLTNDKDGPLDLTDATQVRIDFRKPDGKLVFQYCNIEDRPNGLISAILTTQTLAAPGKVYAEVTAKYPEGKDAVTRQFTFWVQDAIAGDKSIESQNEWPMLERAIVAGDMLAGVDLVAIIQAGELAKGALPKTGGTMTGNRVMDRKLVTNSIYDQFVTGSTSNYFVGVSAAGKYHLYDDIAKITPFEYDPVAKSFNVLSATNVVKKAGDTMTGDLNFDTSSALKRISAYDGANRVASLAMTKSGVVFLEDALRSNFNPWAYDSTTQTFTVAANTNLLKKSGDTMTGTLIMSGSSALIRIDDKGQSVRIDQPNDTTTTSARGLAIYENNVIMGGMGRIRNGTTTDQMYIGWGANPWSENTSLTVSDTKFLYKNKPVAMRDKDGRATITLNTGFTVHDANYGTYADRRGNTVTLRAAVRRGSTATSDTAFTLPADMRPLINLPFNLPTNSGEIVRIVVGTDGTVKIGSIDKDVYLVATYVVD